MSWNKLLNMKLGRNTAAIALGTFFGYQSNFHKWEVVPKVSAGTSESTSINSQQHYMDSPQQWIRFNKAGKMEIIDSVQKQLLQNKNQAVVVSILGRTRLGKSYLMNRLANADDSSGFKVSGSYNAETKGVTIWVKKHPKLRDTHLVLLDTEGLDHSAQVDDESASKNDMQVSLVAMLSSEVIFNTEKQLTNPDLKYLRSICRYSNMMWKHHISYNDISYLPFPCLRIALRDCTLRLKNDEGTEMTKEEYLKNILKVKNAMDTKDKIKVAIKGYFDDRYIYFFPLPATSETFEKYENLPVRKQNKGFQKECDILVTDVITEAKPYCKGMTLSDWAGYVSQIVSALNSETIETMLRGYDYELENSYEEARRASKEYYKREINKIRKELPLKEDQLEKYIKLLKKESLQAFDKLFIGDDTSHFREKFITEFDMLPAVQKLRGKNMEEIKSKNFIWKLGGTGTSAGSGVLTGAAVAYYWTLPLLSLASIGSGAVVCAGVAGVKIGT